MRYFSFLTPLLAFLLLITGSTALYAAPAPAPARPTARDPYVFTDQVAQLVLPGVPDGTSVRYSVKVITRAGWGQTSTGSATMTDGALAVSPLQEGIHVVQFETPARPTLRFLGLTPPGKLNRTALMKALPYKGQRLLAGKTFTILSLGDSVTATGDYESLLVKLLQRSTGNPNVAFIQKAHSGRSVDASVREWMNEGPPSKPDLGLIMYGLNDQITNVPLDAFLEQYRWLAQRLKDLKSDTAFLQPTPDIGIPVTDEMRKPDSNPPAYMLRTLGFGEALRPLAQELKLPLAETFLSLWGPGGSTIEASARSLWPLFPPGYAKQMETLLETDGKGDTIHPNVLGHLQIARAVYAALGGTNGSAHELPAPVWRFKAHTEWVEAGAQSIVTARYFGKTGRKGRFEVHQPSDALLESKPLDYEVRPGQEVTFTVKWSQATKPEDLLNYPADRYLAQGDTMVPVVDFSAGGSRVFAVSAPFEPAASLVRNRQVVLGNRVPVKTLVAGVVREKVVEIAPGNQVGRIPLVEQHKVGKRSAWAVGEVVYVGYGAARSGEAKVDGKLDEWGGARWVPVGLPVQARSWRGPEDNRPQPRDCNLEWAFMAGAKGVYLACRGTGDWTRDTFTLFFDPRTPDLLGTAGRYYWVSGKLGSLGRVDVRKGETSVVAPGLIGAWEQTEVGGNLELFVPYEALDQEAWPKAGDLGLSIIWTHLDSLGRRTQMLWSENGHWWNPRWFGVVRRTDEKNPVLPYMVRVK